jgi:hypothetical protein
MIFNDRLGNPELHLHLGWHLAGTRMRRYG